MSQQNNERGPSQPVAGSVRRARERAQAGLPREDLPPPQPFVREGSPHSPGVDFKPTPLRPMPPSAGGPPRPAQPRQQGPPKDVRRNHNISKPIRVPQWPLPAPPLSPVSPEGPSSHPPPRGPPPQRPQRPRPSQVPSIVDASRQQEPTPIFHIHHDEAEPVPDYDNDEDPAPSGVSSRYTSSSVGTIPEFPAPANVGPNSTARRSINLGPPPSSRRGDSSFYSHASYVSPIPEESPRTRSYGSYASSAAMPEGWAHDSSKNNHGNPEAFYEESITDKSRDSIGDDSGDESKLVRSASLGKRGKPALITTKAPSNPQVPSKQALAPVASSENLGRPSPAGSSLAEERSAYFDVSTSSSNTLPTKYPTPGVTPGTNANVPTNAEGMLGVPVTASPEEGSPSSLASSPLRSSRLAAMRRPPKLDIDAVRSAEARGSMTSLPDLIRRATKLAAMMDKGKRPASRFENLSDYLDEKSDSQIGEKEVGPDERHRSGLSDMLAAFPPPAQSAPNSRRSRGSWFKTTSWPLDPNRNQYKEGRSRNRGFIESNDDLVTDAKPRRRCCGMPLWSFLLLLLVVACGIAAAVVVPLEFFVFKNLGNHSSSDTGVAKCQKTLPCLNGGISVLYGDTCSCICTNGFMGSNCSVAGKEGCITTTLASGNGSASIDNVTIGSAIPRLIADSQANFSIPLSGTTILAKFSAQNLSCIAQNSLVTFDGRSERIGSSNDEVVEISHEVTETGTATVAATATATTLLLAPMATATGPSATATATPKFTTTEEVLDFARVAMLYVLQEETISAAETAQSDVGDFFNYVSEGMTGKGTPVSQQNATDISMGGSNSIDFVGFTVNVGQGPIGNYSTA